jgi:hypothetical protein
MKGKGKHGRRGASSKSIEAREGEILYDRHRREWYRVESVDETGIALHQDGIDFYVPHSLFVGWYGGRLFSVAETRTLEAPEWC